MKIIKHNLLIIFILLAYLQLSFSVFSQPVPNGIILAIKSGNSKELARYFNTSIEIAILENEDVYSKAQAELIIKDFFAKINSILLPF